MIKSNLAVLMAKNEINITELHKATGISRNTISAIYNNTAKGIQYDTLDKLCTYFNADSNDILEFIPMNLYIGDLFTDEYNQTFFHAQINNHIETIETMIKYTVETQKDLYGNVKYTLNIWLKDIIFEEISKVPKSKFDDYVYTHIVDPIRKKLNLIEVSISISVFKGTNFINPIYSSSHDFTRIYLDK